MAPQQDSAGGQFDSALPAAQAGGDVPRWLLVLGIAAGITLVVALLRYAVDLLGVVFVITLIGFSIRAVSDWLTEGETVSGWAVGAVFLSLAGTGLVGYVLFGPRNAASDMIERRLPGPLQRTVSSLESHGWGQRVLLPASSGPGDTGRFTASPDLPQVAGGGANAGPAPRPLSAEPAVLPRAMKTPAARTAPHGGREGSEAEAATAPGRKTRGNAVPAPVPDTSEVVAPPPVARSTPEVTLQVWPATAVVGTSVRLTARVMAEAATGSVIFYRGEEPLGRSPVRKAGDGAAAVLVTLKLPIGEHELSAVYEGDAAHDPARSSVVRQSVVRR